MYMEFTKVLHRNRKYENEEISNKMQKNEL